MYRHMFSKPRHWIEVNGQLQAPATLPPGRNNPSNHCIRGDTFEIIYTNTDSCFTLTGEVNSVLGHVIAQVVSGWLPTAAARVRARVCSSGICGGQSGAGAHFLRVLQFP
jgi:hypothetical protein